MGILFGPAAAGMGYVARRRNEASGGTLGGHGIATAGLALGAVGFVASVAWLVALLSDESFRQFLKAP